jgi:hypothetical protein
VISVGLQVGILHGILEGEIKCPVYIVVMTVALPCSGGAGPAFVCKLVFVGNGCRLWSGSGMEPTAPIIVVDSGIGGLCQQWLSSTEAAVGWSQRRQSLSFTAAVAVFVDNGHC